MGRRPWHLLWMVHSLLLCLQIQSSLCDETLGFGLNLGFGLGSGTVDPCLEECECYNWVTLSMLGDEEKRFAVNCTGMKYGLFQSTAVPKNLPVNTTDLIVAEYQLGALGMSSFPNFPLNPMLLSVSLQSCHVTYLSPDTFQGNSFISIRNITLTDNLFDLLTEGTFAHLPYVQNISMSRNFLQKVQPATFRNLPQCHMINLSHNWIKEIQEGTFDNLPRLEVLDLSHNWLTSIPGKDIFQLPSLKVLNLDGNFWNCSCEMSWVLNMSSVLVESEAICLYPSTLNGTALHELTAEDFQHCFTTDSLIDFYTLSIVTILVLMCGSVLYYMLIRSNQSTHSNQGTVTVAGQITFNSMHSLGHHYNVFRGNLRDGSNVAVKKYFQLSDLQELEILLHLSEKGPPHPNVIRYRCVEKDSQATYLALELCGGNLKDAVSHLEGKFLPFLTPKCCLLQVTRGVKFLHDLEVQHRDIKPQNILWKHSGINSDEVRFIIADFDLGRFNDEHSSHRGMYGTMGWTAPELWVIDKGERSTAVDIFSLGCVFYYVLTLGKHPFGSLENIKLCQESIINNQFSFTDLNEYAEFTVALAEDLLRQMIHHCASERPKACSVMKHPLFWDSREMVTFYHRIGNYIEDKKSPSTKSLIENLECVADLVFQKSWMDRLPEKIVRNDVKGFKEQRTKLCGLLRVVRNKIEHVGHLGEELKAVYQHSGEGVVEYYNRHFPKLLIHTFHVEQEWMSNRNQ